MYDFKELDDYFQRIKSKKEWIGLTDDDLEFIYDSAVCVNGVPFWVVLIRKAELMLKEKNQ